MGIWYKEFYLLTPANEKELRDALADKTHGADVRADLSARLNELNAIPSERCAISADQRRFLERVLASS